MRDHILFLHAACVQPTLETWLLAISRGHFITWPGITTANVRRYLPKSEATAKDTSTNNARIYAQQNKTSFRHRSRLPSHAGNRATNLVFAAVLDYETATNISSILT
jgi:hypothetical protein